MEAVACVDVGRVAEVAVAHLVPGVGSRRVGEAAAEADFVESMVRAVRVDLLQHQRCGWSRGSGCRYCKARNRDWQGGDPGAEHRSPFGLAISFQCRRGELSGSR